MLEFDYEDYRRYLVAAHGEETVVALEEHEAHQAAIVRTRERRRCFDCRPIKGRIRRVVGHFTTQAHFDPTAAYHLSCGHATIDV